MNTTTEDLLYQGKKLRQEGNLEGAIAATEQVIQLHPDYVPAHFQLAEIYESRKEFDKAISHYQSIVQREPNDITALAKLARVMMSQGDIRGAIANYRKAIALESEQPVWVYNGLGDALIQNDRLNEAFSVYQKAVSIKSDVPNIYLKLAQICFEQGNWDGAIENYQKSIKLKPEQPAYVYARLGDALAKNDRRDEALNLLKTAKKAFSEDKNRKAQIALEQKIGDIQFKSDDLETKVSISLDKDKNSYQKNISQLIPVIINNLKLLNISKVIIWGFKHPSAHTHHWIHRAFYRTFKYILEAQNTGIGLFWLDYENQVDRENIENSLFLTACGMYEQASKAKPVYKNLPLSNKSFYLIHGSGRENSTEFFQLADEGRCIFFDEYRGHKEKEFYSYRNKYDRHRRQLNDEIIFDYHPIGNQKYQFRSINFRKIIFPWATDILPGEIELNKKKIEKILDKRKLQNDIIFVGSIWHLNYETIIRTIESASKLGLHFYQRGRAVNLELLKDKRIEKLKDCYSLDPRSASILENIELVQNSFMAPAIQGNEHLGTYIPCRIFKNISYGAIGITNNPIVFDLFDHHIVFDENMDEMLRKAISYSREVNFEQLCKTMNIVRDRHTYLNRIADMLDLLQIVSGT